MIKIYAPASMGNVGVGFDVLGAAISPIDGTLLGDCVSIAPAQQFSLSKQGRFASKLPDDDRDNIVYLCWQRFCHALQREIPAAFILEKNMPIGSGLGSSACSVVATFVALNEYCQKPFTPQQLLQLMGEVEGKISGSIHFDNVAPCYLGGIQLMLQQPDSICQPIPIFSSWYWVMAYPGIKVPTAQARAILPASYSRQTTILQSADLAGFIHACYTNQPLLAAKLMRDRLAEPYRKVLLPDFDRTKAYLLQNGALACGISGSGPTLFAVSDTLSIAQDLARGLQERYLQNDEGFVHICQIDQHGARQIG